MWPFNKRDEEVEAMATDHGTAYILPILDAPVATDYSYNWVNINYGNAFFTEPTGIGGGPDAWYIDFGQPTEPEPPASAVKIWDGTAWTTGAKSWDGTAWVPLKIWDGAQWVT